MIKRYANLAIIYGIMAMVSGVFYREFTKFSNFTGKTNLSVMHTHYFMLGMFFFLILILMEKSFSFSGEKNIGRIVITYQAGLNITGLGFLMRGLAQVWESPLSKGMDASISGIAGIGHIIMSISMLLLLLAIRKKAV